MATSSERPITDLDSPDETTRRWAVEDLGDCGDDAAVELLVRALADPSPAVCEAALDALERIGGETVVQAALPALRSEHVPLRNAASLLLSQLGETAVEHLVGMAADEEKDVRLFAIDTLGRIGSPSAEAAIIRMLTDPDINVAAAAAAALGEVGTASAVGPLIEALKADSWVRCAVAKSLGQIGGVEAAAMLAVLTAGEDELVAYAAIQALTQMENTTAHRGAFRDLVDHSNPVIRDAAAAALEGLSSVRVASGGLLTPHS
jgi:HEAT repeat protein